MIKSDYVAI